MNLGTLAEEVWENTIRRAMHNSIQSDPDKDVPKILFLVHRADMKSAPKGKLKNGL